MIVGTAPVGTFQLPTTRRPELPEHVNNIAELALAHSPEDRYQTARDFVMDIQRIFDGSAMESTGSKMMSIPLLIGGVMIGLCFLGLFAIILFNLRPNAEKVAEANDAAIRKNVVEEARDAIPSSKKLKQVLANHPPNMAYIPAGEYLSGAMEVEKFNNLARPGEPTNIVKQVDAFVIDMFEYPNSPNAKPMLKLTALEAQKECEKVGKRLCTANEWEKACKGPNMYAYSYGDTFDPSFCGNGLDDLGLTGSRPTCKNAYGVFDMSGNFREWTSTVVQGTNNRLQVRGGVRAAAEKGTRCAFSKDERRSMTDKSISFRCCRDADAPKFVPPAAPPK